MLILTAKQVKYCRVIRQVAREAEILSGAVYQGKLFVRGKSYPVSQRQQAIRHSRQFFQEQQDGRLCLVVESDRAIVLWYEDDNLKLANRTNLNSQLISRLNLEKVVARLQGKNGLGITERRYHLKTYPPCFVGSEAVTWMVKRFRLSQELAIALGQRLLDEQWIRHVTDEHPFKNEYLFYYFCKNKA